MKPPQACQESSTWTPWSTCSKPCAGGVQYRTRAIQQQPTDGGSSCEVGDFVQSQSCNNDVPCGVDCIPGNSGPDSTAQWSGCPSCTPASGETPMQWRFIPPSQNQGLDGKPCALQDVFQVRACSITYPAIADTICTQDKDCEIDTSVITYQAPCSAQCGTGTQLTMYSISQLPQGLGRGCDWNELIQSVQCNAGACPSVEDCATQTQGKWQPWTTCTSPCGLPADNWQFSTRIPDGPDDTCPTLKSQSCLPLASCPATRSSCAPPTWDLLQSLCYLQCAGDPQALSYATQVGYCSVSQALLDEVCEQGDACAAPADCSLTDWSTWSSCTIQFCDPQQFAEGGVQQRTRAIVAEASGGGVPCSVFLLNDTRPCTNSVAVTYQAVDASGMGLTQTTMAPQCNPQPCQLSNPYLVESCSVACGTGVEWWAQSVTVPAKDGGSCRSNLVSQKPCTQPACGTCTLQRWEDYFATCGSSCWSPCSAACNGVKFATRSVVTPAPLGGTCDFSQLVTQTACCENCNCDTVCPIGAGQLPCGGHGTCTSQTTDGGVSWQGTCTCDEGWQGYACGDRGCPLGPNGQLCNGPLFGTCSGRSCTCNPGISGDACTQGGWCYISTMMNWTQTAQDSASSPWVTQTASYFGDIGAVPIDSTFTEVHCEQLAALPPIDAQAFVVPQISQNYMSVNANGRISVEPPPSTIYTTQQETGAQQFLRTSAVLNSLAAQWGPTWGTTAPNFSADNLFLMRGSPGVDPSALADMSYANLAACQTNPSACNPLYNTYDASPLEY